MAIEAEVDNLDAVPAQFHELCTELNGKFVVTGVNGIKPLGEFNKVYGGLTKERNDHKASKDIITAYKALGELPDLQSKLDRIAELEAAAGGKLDEAAIEKLVSTRLTGKTAPLERNIAQLTKDLGERDTILAQYKAKDVQRGIHDSLREALKKHEGFQASAFDDAAMLAERMFEVNEDGRVVTKDGVGVTPGVDAAVWLTEMQTKRPHWWGPSAGTGATGNRGTGTGGATNPWSHEGWNMTAQGALYKENPQRAEQMAKAAGTKLGGGKPAPKR